MTANQKRPWGRAVASAATGRVNLAVAGATALGAAALGSVPLLGVGLAAYAALVAWDLASPQHWKRVLAEDPTTRDLPDPDTLGDPILKNQVQQIATAREGLTRILRESPPEVKDYVAQALASLGPLEQAAVRLVARGEDLWRYLASVEKSAVKAEMNGLGRQADQTSDPDARAEFQRARAIRQQQLSTIEELERALDRVHANLSRIVAAYEGLPARLVHLRTLSSQARDAVSGDVNQELNRMNQEMTEFEQTLKEVAAEVGG